MTARDRTLGTVKSVTSLTNPAIKEIRALSLKKNRDASGRFIAEGLKLMTDALDGEWPVETMLFSRGASGHEAVMKTAARARARGAGVLEVPDKILSAISRRDNPQTVIGVFAQRWTRPEKIDPGHDRFWIALDRIRDPGNLGTILRTADAFGASGVILVGETTDPFGIDAVRATMGSIFNVPLCRMAPQAFVEWRKKWPGIVVGTHLAAETDFRDPDYSGKSVLLLMGNEQQGLPEELAQACDHLCLIPMAGRADSLNLAVATGVMAFEIRRHLLGRSREKIVS